ncbi:MAG: hypothetical protein FJ266_15435 [Planctomycetes bacterium]|nr:hypothetical protein [Planctomycetota bacterium]
MTPNPNGSEKTVVARRALPLQKIFLLKMSKYFLLVSNSNKSEKIINAYDRSLSFQQRDVS